MKPVLKASNPEPNHTPCMLLGGLVEDGEGQEGRRQCHGENQGRCGHHNHKQTTADPQIPDNAFLAPVRAGEAASVWVIHTGRAVFRPMRKNQFT